MNSRLPTLAAALSIAGLLGWLVYQVPEGPAPSPPAPSPAPGRAADISLQERSGGSEVPCAVPLAWRVARVDPEFPLGAEEATAAIREAARLWEDGLGRALFDHDPEAGFPIRIVYDERQERAQARIRRIAALETLRGDIEARRAAVTARGERYRAAMADYLARTQELDRRVTEHNAAIRAWNESDDRSEERWRALEAVSAELRAAQAEMASERPALDEEQAALRATEEALNELISEHGRLVDGLEAALPPEEVEAGVYREAVSRENGEVVAVSREIRLYRFADRDELRLLAAHELGHALGLGHTDDAAGVMHARARADDPVTALASSDVALFRSLCPAEDADR